jgi:acyl-CoA reductase-like NAD-dependent aldehyde dehydrogenase
MAPGIRVRELVQTLAAHAAHTGGSHDPIAVRMPFTGEIFGHLPAAMEPDVDVAVARARAAQPAWESLSPRHRAAIFLRFHDLLLARQNEVLDLIQLETGKARRHAFEEILDTAVVSRYYARHAPRILRSRRHRGALPLLTKTIEERVPLGVVGFFIPWNFPLVLAITDAIAALMAGNAAILKPDPQASFTALWSVALLRECGLPGDVLQVITGEPAEVGNALVGRVDYVTFTGSARIGRIIGSKAGERLIGCSLELGGKNPMLVLQDADLERAVDGAVRGCFCGAGQVCVSIERIYVHESRYEEFVACFAARTSALRLGAGFDFSTDMGSLTTERQLRAVEAHVEDALAKGAKLRAGGRPRPDLGPLFYEPTILTGVTNQMRVYGEETFGPVVAVYPFGDEDEAVALANDTPYGLSASIWSRDTRRAARLAGRILAGSVNINESYAACWGSVDSPIGGLKRSGLHPRHGAEGILKYTASRTVAVQRIIPIAPFGPVGPELWGRWMTAVLRLIRKTRLFE